MLQAHCWQKQIGVWTDPGAQGRPERASALLLILSTIVAVACGMVSEASAVDSITHPAMRPLPVASARPLASGTTYFVDAEHGNNQAAGSLEQPWKTIAHALGQAKPGETIALRKGIYYEHIDILKSGAEEKPVTVRSYPGELVIIDGGLREFLEVPEQSWMPLADQDNLEFISTRTYPAFAARPVLNSFLSEGWEPFHGIEDQRPVVLGHFADTMVPLHGYRTLTDLRDPSMLWDVDNKFEVQEGVYCGPGLWFNRETNRFHIRLAHTDLKGLGPHGYRGETDPRKVPLAISGPCGVEVLRINGIRHLVFQDLVFRGASGSPLINIHASENITFDGVTVFGGSPGMLIKSSGGLKIVNSAFRGLAAPWSSRASMKYRGTPSYVIIADQEKPENHDFEFAFNEFTDGHDFGWFRYIKNLKFHHNYVDNFNDDGLEVGAKKRTHELYFSQNLVSRCLISLTLHEMDQDESPKDVDSGSGVFVTRNVFDLRRGVFVSPPRTAEDAENGDFLNRSGMFCSDHGGPVWPHYYVYHNTIVRNDAAWRNYYGFGIGSRGTRETKRYVFNNLFVQLQGIPGLSMPPDDVDFALDGNLHWGVVDGPGYEGDFFKQPALINRKTPLPETWLRHDLFADPRLKKLTANVNEPFDLTIAENSPARDAGVPIPVEWFDPLREYDSGQPDMGALPVGAEPSDIGVRGRLSLFGASQE